MAFMVKSKQQILGVIREHKQAFRDLGASRIGLFGSVVRGDQTAGSDIDLLVEFVPGRKNYRNLLGTADLAESLVGKKVEIVTPESVSPFIVPHIQKEAEYVQIA